MPPLIAAPGNDDNENHFQSHCRLDETRANALLTLKLAFNLSERPLMTLTSRFLLRLAVLAAPSALAIPACDGDMTPNQAGTGGSAAGTTGTAGGGSAMAGVG